MHEGVLEYTYLTAATRGCFIYRLLLTLVDKFRARDNSYHSSGLNMTLCWRWPPCRSIHCYSRDGNDVITRCSISVRISWIHYRIRQCDMRVDSAWKHCLDNLHGNLCSVSSCSKHHFAWWRSAWKHRVRSFKQSGVSGTTDTGPPASLILKHQTTWFRATSEVRCTKHVLSILMT